ncbi:DUF4255 domain-containing protein [Terracidiphilus sp.]|jgi:hypothetical protein|uniref:DUF4255 domain-containing protein n=1 Tax=Terracidiphilus sp. TaxID=1964191 RepID=UPI003C2362DE
MSSALALSAVTSVLQTSLGLVYNSSALGTITVSAIAPDVVETKYGIGPDSGPLVNLFLHQVTPNAAWRNIDFPSLAADGSTRLKNPPLALDLHYLLTAYASEDTEAEALLGYAILMLHENPILPRALITSMLGKLSSSTYNDALQAAGVDAQIEMIKLSPATLGREEMAWLWTALKADYRPTFPFQASVVLMRNDNPAAFSLPVLTRNIVVQPGVSAQLFGLQPPNDQSPALVGDTVQVNGSALSTASQISIANPTTHVTYLFAPAIGSAQDTSVSFQVPEDPANLPSGVCELSLIFKDSSGNVTQHTSNVVLGIGLKIAAAPVPSAAASGGGTLVALGCDPQVRSGQNVYLVLSSQTNSNMQVVVAQPFTAQTASLSFQFAPALAADTYAAQLQVDGVLAPVASNWKFTPPGTLTVLP